MCVCSMTLYDLESLRIEQILSELRRSSKLEMPYVPRAPLPAHQIQGSLEKLRCGNVWDVCSFCLALASRILQPWPSKSPKSTATLCQTCPSRKGHRISHRSSKFPRHPKTVCRHHGVQKLALWIVIPSQSCAILRHPAPNAPSRSVACGLWLRHAAPCVPRPVRGLNRAAAILALDFGPLGLGPRLC